MRYALPPAARFAACVALATVGLSAVGCANLKVPKPTSDATPPAVVWNVLNVNTGEQADHPGSPTIAAKRGDRYQVILKAIDPEGVQSIRLNPTLGSGELAWQCRTSSGGENLAQNRTATLGPLTQNLAPNPDGTVLTSIFLISNLDLTMECQAGWQFASGSARLTGQASNYFGGTTTEAIRFNVAP